MGLCGVRVGLGLLLWTYGLGALVCAVQDYWDDPSHLHCGSAAMEFSLPSLLDDAVFSLAIIGKDGKPHYLRNDSTCGTWIGEKSDGSLVVGSTFDGCYVREENENYVVTITLEEVLRDGGSQYHKKDLKCPMLLAMDAPSPSECASVQPVDLLQCGNDSISSALCAGRGCCFSQNFSPSCYYGKKLTAYCSVDDNMVVVISKNLTAPPLILSSVHADVNSSSCPALTVVTTASFIGFRFPLSCGSANKVADTIVYQHTFEATRDVITWQSASITRDSTMRLSMSCSYSQTGVVPLQAEVVTLPPPPPVATTGPLLLEMRIAEDGTYNYYYTNDSYPIGRVLRDPVDVEVRILQSTDPNLVLMLNSCWATNSPVPTDVPQWPLLVNSCPYAGDNYLTVPVFVAPSPAVLFPTHYARFNVSTFTFVDATTQTALKGLVYFHCSASVCVPSATESCAVSCVYRRKRMAKSVNQENALTTVTSHGPVIFYEEKLDVDAVQEEGSFDSVLFLAGLQGAAAAGLFLMVALLGIYFYKRQRKCVISTVNA